MIHDYFTKNTYYLSSHSLAESLKRRRGGIRQRLDDFAESTKPALDSGLANFLLEQFAWGYMSPQLVQQIALLAVKDINNVVSTGDI